MNTSRLIKCLLFFVIFFLIGSNISLSITDIISNNDSNDIDHEDIPKLKWMGPHGSYEDYINGRDFQDFYIKNTAETIDEENDPLIMVFINANLIPEIENEISIYNKTLRVLGYNTVIMEVVGGTIEDLKSLILSYWNDGYNVTGVVLIGDHPVAWYYLSYDGSDFPCDLFLMDLDGEWVDTDHDGMYDSHLDGSGDTAPEIYSGRIDASNIPGDEITILKTYFNKVLDFWLGNIEHTDYGLTYTEEDWSYWNDIRFSIQYTYSDYDAIWYPDVQRDDYVYNRVSNDSYEFLQLACHSWSSGHYFTDGYVSSNEIRNAPPNALFYNLFCCGALRFTDYNCLGNAYILDTDSPSLSVVGSSKSGSMLDFYVYYQALADNTFGKAFQQWFEYEAPYSNSDKSWFYGMMILGDPTLDHKPVNLKEHNGYVTSISSKWNLIALPFNKSVIKNDLIIKCDNNNYSWMEAISNDIIGPYIFGWNGSTQIYTLNGVLHPGNGYWIYAYEDCEIWTDQFISTIDVSRINISKEWNIIGISDEQDSDKSQLTLNCNGTIFNWSEAVSAGIISDYIFGWNRTDQSYFFSDTFQSGFSYWMYAFDRCILIDLLEH